MSEEKKKSPCGAGKKHKDHPDCTCGTPKIPLKEKEQEWNSAENIKTLLKNDRWVGEQDWTGVVLAMYADGAADAEIRVTLAISTDLWYRYMKEEQKFAKTIKEGRERSYAWWLKKGRKGIDAEKFNATPWVFNMKNRFKWTDRKDVTTKGEALTISDVLNQAEDSE